MLFYVVTELEFVMIQDKSRAAVLGFKASKKSVFFVV